VHIEPVHRVNQAEARYLDQIIERLATVGEAAGDVISQGQAPLYQGVALSEILRGPGGERREVQKHRTKVGIF
jgi:hypothetical protein